MVGGWVRGCVIRWLVGWLRGLGLGLGARTKENVHVYKSVQSHQEGLLEGVLNESVKERV